MEYPYEKEILELSAFRAVFAEIKAIDLEYGENIEQSLKAALMDSHGLLLTAKNREQLHLALLKEQISVQAQSSQYLSITDELNMKKTNLLEYAPKVYHEFMNEVEWEANQFFQKKKLEMYGDIDRGSAWYSGITDSTKKGGGAIVNFAAEKINQASKQLQGKTIIGDPNVIDTKTVVETVLEKHLSMQKLTDEISRIFETAMETYRGKWIKQLSTNIPDVQRLSAFSIAHSAKAHLDVDFRFGEAEQVFAMGMGSALMGTIGLAAGWHTLTYAIFNVFPPIALFAAFATIAVGVFTKDRAIEKRKKDINEAVTRFHHFFLQQLYVLQLENLDHKSLSEYMESKGQEIVNEAVKEWEKRCFGKLKIEQFRKLNQAFTKHLMYINEALEAAD